MSRKLIILIAALSAAAAGCKQGGDAAFDADTIVAVGDCRLTRADVGRTIPSGLSQADSTRLANAYIRSWIDSKLIIDVASEDIDMTEIDRLVDSYREELIKSEYRRTMAARIDESFISADSLQAYYQAHKNSLKLERPLLKGVYLKVPDDSRRLSEIRRLYRSDRADDIDNLEKAALSDAVHYDYFRDRWVDIEQVETKIPVTFTDALRQQLSQHRPLEVASEGFVYLLQVTDYLPAGSVMPFEAAQAIITERLLSQRRRDFDAKLMDDLYRRCLDDGIIRYPSSDQ